MWTPSDSAIRVTPEIAKALETANAEQIKVIMAQAAIDQGLVQPDRYDASVLLPTALAAAAPKKFAKTISLNGKKHTLEAESPEALAEAELNFFRSTFGQGDDNAQGQFRDANGRFTADQGKADEAVQARQRAEAEAAAKADLELKFKRGELSADDFLAQSGAIDKYLSSKGVSMTALQEASAASYQRNWTQAVEEFLAKNPDWQGGPKNMTIIGQILQENNLTDNPSAESLQLAFEHAKRENLLSQNEDVALESKISSAKSHAELQELLHPNRTTSSSGGGYFGGR